MFKSTNIGLHTLTISGPMMGRRAAFRDMLDIVVGLRGLIRSNSGRLTGTGMEGTCPEHIELFLAGATTLLAVLIWLKLVSLSLREEENEAVELA